MEHGKPRAIASHLGQRPIIACDQCDLVQYEVPLGAHVDAHCVRCNAVLYRGARSGLDWLLALTSGTVLLFFVANILPIASVDIQGSHSSTTLTGTALALYHQGRPWVAGLVLATTVLLPALQLGALLYLLLPLRFGYVPRGVAIALRFLLAARPWNMIDVFLLGALITLIKLLDVARVVPGVAMWAFAGSVLLSAAIAASFSTRDFWAWVESAPGALADKAA